MHHLVAVALIFGAQKIGVGRARTAFGLIGKRRFGRKRVMFAHLLVFSFDDIHREPLPSSLFAQV